MILKKRFLRAAASVAAVQLLALTAFGPAARAQTADPQPADPTEAPANPPAENPNAGAAPGGGELQQVVVTGTLIPHIGTGPQPVTTYDEQYIKNTGYQTVTDVLQNLPGATGNFNPGVTTGFSFSPGGASIALKGLPPNDTLVLVDGLRMPSYPFPQVSVAGAFNYVDINSIPLAAIDRIEILNDGGSATYGTDAVAGVVNFILKDQYQGADINNYFGISQRGDYEVYHGQFVGGIKQYLGPHSGSGGEPADDGKTPPPVVAPAFTPYITLVAAFDFYTQSPINAVDRRFANEDFTLLSPRYPAHPDFPPTTGQFTDTVTGNFFQVNPGFNGVNPTPADFTSTPYSTFTSGTDGLQIYPRETRIGGLIKLDFQATDWLKLYNSFLINRTEEVASYGPNQGIYPPPFNPGVIVPANNPFNPFGHALLVDGWAGNEFGLLNTDTTITTFREVVGGTVTLPHGFYIDSNWLYGEADGTETMKNMFFFDGMQQALAGTLPGNVGDFFNPFADESANTGPNRAFYGNPNLIGSIYEDIRSSIMQFHTVGGTTDLFDLPSGSLAVAGGFEYRSEDYIQNDDSNSKSGNLTAIQFPIGALINGRRGIWSIFGEVDIPILGNQWSWPGLNSLQLTISQRQDYYSDFGSTAKPKFALLYKPISDFAVQASYTESFVAPSLPQLFTISGLPAETLLIDPKFPQLGEITVLDVTPGNPNLKPENAYMYYVRGTWTPGASDPEHSWWKWANGFTAYVDWFQLDQHDVFGTLTGQEVANLASPPPGNSVIRNPATGVIDEIINGYTNLGDVRSEGVEFGFSYYSKEYNWGKIELNFDASYLYWVTAQTVQGVNANGTLFYRVFNNTDTANGAAPDFKFLISGFYSKTVFAVDTFRTGLTLHFVGSELDFNNSSNGTNPMFPVGSFEPDNGIPGNIHTIGNWTTLDWQISYQFGAPTQVTPETPKPGYNKEGKRIVGEKAIAPAPEGPRSLWRTLLANTTITFGINNIFDTPPPLSVDNVISNFDNAGGANFIQRYFWFSIDKKF
jgi:iron complex outermembrane recepter protein